MNFKKFFGVSKIIIGLSLFLSTVFAIVFELLTHYYFNKAEYLVYYNEFPAVLKFFMNFSASLGAIITSLIAFYFYKSGIFEFKNQKPIILILRVLINSIPAILSVYYSFIVYYTIFVGSTSLWTLTHKIILPFLIPLFAFIFVREFFLDKFYSKEINENL